ncbi:MAG: GTP 3',8-cyclase MoaA [Gammaproteobacteria bacterium]|nr:GTP 3',8-cyclase MoaA [Gammaproteobacteria bacterium]
MKAIIDEPQHSQALIDPYGRRIDYLRLSVTDKCNLRCFYCLPKGFKDFETPSNWLSFAEIERVVRAFGELGVSRVRLTGGEPLVRKDLARLVSQISALPGIHDLSLSTNATLLEQQAQDLYRAGIRRINVSLDTLDKDQFAEITGGGKLQQVLNGLQKARAVGFSPIKVNMVVMKDTQLDDYRRVLDYCMQNDFTLRFIETMPMGSAGRDASAQYLNLDTVRQRLNEEYDLVPGIMTGGGPARYYRINNTDFEIGFITPISQHFCETCNRVRLSVDGTLYLCLGQDDKLELRPLLRAGISDDDLQQEIIQAIAKKPQKHEFNQKPGQVVRLMALTGG